MIDLSFQPEDNFRVAICEGLREIDYCSRIFRLDIINGGNSVAEILSLEGWIEILFCWQPLDVCLVVVAGFRDGKAADSFRISNSVNEKLHVSA